LPPNIADYTAQATERAACRSGLDIQPAVDRAVPYRSQLSVFAVNRTFTRLNGALRLLGWRRKRKHNANG
jgi:hypothetical protein